MKKDREEGEEGGKKHDGRCRMEKLEGKAGWSSRREGKVG